MSYERLAAGFSLILSIYERSNINQNAVNFKSNIFHDLQCTDGKLRPSLAGSHFAIIIF